MKPPVTTATPLDLRAVEAQVYKGGLTLDQGIALLAVLRATRAALKKAEAAIKWAKNAGSFHPRGGSRYAVEAILVPAQAQAHSGLALATDEEQGL